MALTDDQLLRVRAGALSFNQFAREARQDFRALAIGIFAARARGVYTIDEDDLVQVMLLTAFHCVGEWRPEMNYPIKKYVVWMACSRASRLCKHQRARAGVNVLGVKASACDERSGYTSARAVAPLQELEVEVVERLRDLPATRWQVMVMNSVFETQCVDASTDELLADPSIHRMFGGDREAARRGIYRTVKQLTKRASSAR